MAESTEGKGVGKAPDDGAGSSNGQILPIARGEGATGPSDDRGDGQRDFDPRLLHMVKSLIQSDPNITNREIEQETDRSKPTIVAYRRKAEQELGIARRARRKSRPSSEPSADASSEDTALSGKLALKIAEAQKHDEVVEQSTKFAQAAGVPPPPTESPPSEVSPLVVGQATTGGTADATEAEKKAKETATAIVEAIKAGNTALLSSQISQWVWNAGVAAYSWWDGHGLRAEFTSPKSMLDKSILFWWETRDRVALLENEIMRLRTELADLRQQQDPRVISRQTWQDIHNAALLGELLGQPISRETISNLVEGAKRMGLI